jgi:protocatechuate 3,4-dioxygenase beta subunit
MNPDRERRTLILGMAASLLSSSVLAAPLRPTPAQTAGPFYPPELPLDADNDLTRVRGASGVAQGQVTDLTGRLLDLDGRPIRAVRIEIWQCDANGRYRHPDDHGPAPDPHFQGLGHAVTDADGRYRFRTIRPVPYPGRTPHIHYAVFLPGQPPFTTQLYIAGEPMNQRDFLFRAVPPERRHLLQAEFRPARSSRAEFAASFDLVMGGRGGTPRA